MNFLRSARSRNITRSRYNSCLLPCSHDSLGGFYQEDWIVSAQRISGFFSGFFPTPQPGVQNPEVFQVKDGRVDVLQGPGLGIEINEPLVRETAKRYGEMKEYKPWRNPTWRGEDGELREW